jgi:hypothetical protein
MNYSLTVCVGDIFEELSHQAKKIDPGAFLVDNNNVVDIVDKPLTHDIVVYTSLGEFNGNHLPFLKILQQADKIYYFPPDHWSDGKILDFLNPTESTQGLTEQLLLMYSDKVVDTRKQQLYFSYDINPVVDDRKTQKLQMWVAGCSISHGVGVTQSERYGEILSRDFQLPCSFLTAPGSSIDWAADQILRCDLRPGDIVIWGLTNTNRTSYYHQQNLLHLNPNAYKRYPYLESICSQRYLLSETLFFQHLYSIERVINICQKLNVKLLIVGLLPEWGLFRFLKTLPNYFLYPYNVSLDSSGMNFTNFVDLGSDASHPGPKQHNAYKDFIKLKLKELNFI